MHHLRFPDIVNSRYCPSSVFETYAAKNWAAHFRKAHNMITEEQVYQAKQLCDANSQRYKKWLDVFWRTQSKKAPVGQDESLFRGSPERFTTLMIDHIEFGVSQSPSPAFRRGGIGLEYNRSYTASICFVVGMFFRTREDC